MDRRLGRELQALMAQAMIGEATVEEVMSQGAERWDALRAQMAR